MLGFVLLLFSSSMHQLDSCIPTAPSPMPIRCRSCSPTLITITAAFSTETNAIANGCTVRTATCVGLPAEGRLIRWNGGNVINADATGTATLAATCDVTDTAWIFQGTPVTDMGCYTGCRSCSPALITITAAFSTETNSIVNGCTWNGANIINADATGTATLVATCNAAGAAWIYQGMPVTDMGCYARCSMCSPALITITATLTTDNNAMVNGCAVRTATCMGSPAQSLFMRWNGANVINPDATGTAILAATCDAAGGAWIYQGVPVTDMGCYSACCRTDIFDSASPGLHGRALFNPTLTSCPMSADFYCSSRADLVTDPTMIIVNGVTTIATGPMGTNIIATLTCNANKEWIAPNGQVVNKIGCLNNP